MTTTLPGAPSSTAPSLTVPSPTAAAQPRGDVSAAVLSLIAGRTAPRAVLDAARAARPDDVLRDEDVQLALTLMYEAHYSGAGSALDPWEWDTDLLTARAVLEEPFEAAVRDLVDVPDVAPEEVTDALFALTAPDGKPGLAAHMARRATPEQWREWMIHRSMYHLAEGDSHTWAIPRLPGAVKAALVEIQADEYGGGSPERMHSALFARSMRAQGLDDRYGAYLDQVPAISLAVVNLVSLFGLHRRLLGEVVGHLSGYEMTSSLPHRLYGNGLRRVGHDSTDATWFFDEHVEADAVHEQIAARELAGGLALAEPWRARAILFGATAGLTVSGLAGDAYLAAWSAGRSSLRTPGSTPA